ncbi:MULTISPECIES: Flp pilus assembly protein CpaB [unclassified Phenylobacterium]|uniref:Flp pilus assembly protein CpaB n=1 Tax=unclassified Phenylobacterium TaxID=2640670 RepID=UPI00083A1958|nr:MULTISPECIES: Flp pilus assembly protein CpaB [unclassified Phenylobacterium]
MRVVTIVSLAASAVLGLGALFVAKIALPNASAAKTPMRAEAVGKPVVVASRPLKYGEKLDAGMLTVIKVPANAIPEGSFATVEQALAADRGGAPVVLVPVASREALLPAKLSGPGARPSVAAEVSEGMRAYTLKVNDASGVGGHALPGDHVDVVLMRDLTPQGEQRNYISYVVVQNARVLGVDLNADPTSNKPASPSTATIEVSVEDSQKLSIAATLGELSLALRRNGAAEIEDAPPLRTADFLVGGGQPRTGGGAVRSAPAPARSSAILIIEGEPSKRSRTSRRSAAPAATPPAAAAPTATS